MATIEIFVSSSVRPTERVDRVVSAIENIFPGLVMDIRTDRIEAYDGPESLRVMHELLRRQKILDAARSEMLRRPLWRSRVMRRVSSSSMIANLIDLIDHFDKSFRVICQYLLFNC